MSTAIGGQAVLEGVMMRSPSSWAVAVRKPDGKIAQVVNAPAAQLARVVGAYARKDEAA